MNVFYTNADPVQAAREHNLVHRRKMIVEYAQLMSTAHHVLDGGEARPGIYKATHVNHPSAVWIRQAGIHYAWVYRCAQELCRLYTEQTGKVHKTQAVIKTLGIPPCNIPVKPGMEPPVAAPNKFKAIALFDGACIAYQQYLLEKFDEWRNREKPIAVEFDVIPQWVSEAV